MCLTLSCCLVAAAWPQEDLTPRQPPPLPLQPLPPRLWWERRTNVTPHATHPTGSLPLASCTTLAPLIAGIGLTAQKINELRIRSISLNRAQYELYHCVKVAISEWRACQSMNPNLDNLKFDVNRGTNSDDRIVQMKFSYRFIPLPTRQKQN